MCKGWQFCFCDERVQKTFAKIHASRSQLQIKIKGFFSSVTDSCIRYVTGTDW